jgi:L-histidine N-alpha-methyltransferase
MKMCEAVKEGLDAAPRSLPTRFLYDRAGSELFEQITRLPEYYLTRTEQAILNRYGAGIAETAGENTMLIEFGSGSSMKTRLLIEAILQRQADLRYVPIDISHDFLCQSSDALLADYSRLTIEALGAEYFDAVQSLPAHDGPRLILFLGSNIGNFTYDQSLDFLVRLRLQMTPVDRLLLGIDLAKSRSIVEPAYNDAQGVTAAFNLNLLARINRELDANFDLGSFAHRAPYDETLERVEMQLISLTEQSVCIDGIGKSYRLAPGEAIHTEWSHKYTIESFTRLAGEAGLKLEQHWTDPNAWFATVMLKS